MSNNLIKSNLSPIIETFTTTELKLKLKKINLNSISNLLNPFKNSIEKVNIRLNLNSNFESNLLNYFPIQFNERFLIEEFKFESLNLIQGNNNNNLHNRRLSLAQQSNSNSTSPNSNNTPLPNIPPTSSSSTSSPHNQQQQQQFEQSQQQQQHQRVSISYSHSTQLERDELFLDSLSSHIATKSDSWINNNNSSSPSNLKEELKIKLNKSKKKRFDSDQQPDDDSTTKQNNDTNGGGEDTEEGWQNKPLEDLTPWYTTMRDEIFKRREMVEYETFAWPVGVLLALSSSHPDPLGALSSLWDLTSKEKLFNSNSYPTNLGGVGGGEGDGRNNWVNPDVLRFIVLVHDFGEGGGRDGWEDAKVLHETIRKTYGIHTALLPIFSASKTALNPQPKANGLNLLWPSLPLPTSPVISFSSSNNTGLSGNGNAVEKEKEMEAMEIGNELSEGDLKAIRIFLRELVVQSLIPFMERSILVGNEQWNSSKRSIGGRLFSAGKKYFGSSNTNSRSTTPIGSSVPNPLGYNVVKGWYPFTAQESQTRRLGDLAFMIGDYKLASIVYESVSKEFKNDKAWKYFSSACRMTGLSQLMLQPQGSSLNFNPDIWLELSLQVPSPNNNSTMGVDLDGLRSMMMFYELYRFIGDWRPAVDGLIRTAGEVDEVSSAILLEQAAISDLHLPRLSKRKYAFHMTMAAKRYEQTGLKSLSRRCLSQATTIYRLNSSQQNTIATIGGWQAIRSHLYYELGRQAYNVGKADEAVEHFLELLVGGGGEGGGGGEESWLDDFGLAWEHLSGDTERVVRERNLKLHATIFNPKDVHVRVVQNGNISTIASDGPEWEELGATFSIPNVGSTSRKTEKVSVDVVNQAVAGETFYLELKAQNPLDAPLAIGGLRIETDAEEGVLEIEAPKEIELGPREALRIYVPIKATRLTTFKFTSVTFRFNDLLPCTESLIKKPKRLNATRDQLVTPTYAEDTSLSVIIRSPIPILSISLDELPDNLYAGEARMTSITLTNTGQVALIDLKAICSHPSFILFQQHSSSSSSSSTLYNKQSVSNASSTISSPNYLIPNTPFQIPLESSTSSNLSSLEAGASVKVPILCRGDAGGNHSVKFLFTFLAVDNAEIFTSRAIRELHIQPSIKIRPLVRTSNSPSIPFLLSLETFNLALPSDFTITQITSISPQWKCSLLDGFSLKDDLAPIGFQQSASMYLAVEPVISTGEENQEDGSKFAARQLDSLLQGREVKGSRPNNILLHHTSISSSGESVDTTSSALFASVLQTHVLLRHASLTAQLPTIDSSLHQYLFPLFNSRSIDLLVFWSSPSKNLSGHHHLAGIPIGAGSNVLKQVLETAELKAGGLYAESQRERSTLLAGLRRSEFGIDDDPATVTLQIPEVSHHDFESGACSITLTFYIRNCSISTPFNFTLLLQSDGSSSPNRLAYSGSLTHRGSVAPLSVIAVKTKAWVQRHGMYDAGDWSLEVVNEEGQTWRKIGISKQIRISDVDR